MAEKDGDAMSCVSSNVSGKRSQRKTREELNDLEKQRTKRINQHIVALRNLLEMSNISTKKDKFSVLKNTYDYIVKLRQDIAKLNRRPVGEPSSVQSTGMDTEINISHESLFCDAEAPMALASLDGQFLKSNEKFEMLTGYSSRDLTKMTLFNFTVSEEMNHLFNVIGSLLTYPEKSTVRHFWKTCKFRDKIETCFVSLWVVRRKGEEASCFQMTMVPLADCDGVWSSDGPMKQTSTPVATNDKETVDQWTTLQQRLLVAPGGTMGTGGTVGLAGGVRHFGSTNDSKGDDHRNMKRSGDNDVNSLRMESGGNLSGNLTDAANRLANVQYSGEEEEGDDNWSAENFYDEIFCSLMEEGEDYEDYDGQSDNTLDV